MVHKDQDSAKLPQQPQAHQRGKGAKERHCRSNGYAVQPMSHYAGRYLVHTEVVLEAVVQDDDHDTTETTEDLGEGTLVHTGETLGGHDLAGAVDTRLVLALLLGQVRLEHHAAAHGVERVVERQDDGTGNGTNDDGRDETLDSLVLLVGVEAHDGSVKTELTSTVHEGTGNGDSGTTVQADNTLLLDGLGEAVEDAVELTLASGKIRSKAGTGVVERVADDHSGTSTETTSEQVGGEELGELSVLVVLREQTLEEVVERQSGTLLGSVSEAVHEVTTPEGADTLLGSNTAEAVDDT